MSSDTEDNDGVPTHRQIGFTPQDQAKLDKYTVIWTPPSLVQSIGSTLGDILRSLDQVLDTYPTGTVILAVYLEKDPRYGPVRSTRAFKKIRKSHHLTIWVPSDSTGVLLSSWTEQPMLMGPTIFSVVEVRLLELGQERKSIWRRR